METKGVKTCAPSLYVDVETPHSPKDLFSTLAERNPPPSRVSPWDRWPLARPSGGAAHLFLQTLQLHFQVLQGALPLDQLILNTSQSLGVLLHGSLHRLQLHGMQKRHRNELSTENAPVVG